MTLSVIQAPDLLRYLHWLVPLVALWAAFRVGRMVLGYLSLQRRTELIRALQVDAPDVYQALGKPSPTLVQQMSLGRDWLANDRLWFAALWRPEMFPAQAGIQAALCRFRRIEWVSMGYSVFLVILAILILVMHH